MILKKSIHYNDAVVQSANMPLLQLIERYKSKWQIVATLVYKYKGGLHAVYYLDNNNNCVHYRLTQTPTSYPIIGEVTYTEEEIEVK